MTRILVVDDEPLVRMLVVQALSELGCQVEQAGTVREALSKFGSIGDGLSAAIIDLGLPDRPGDELMRQLRASRPGLPMLLATGYAGQDLRKRLAGDGHLRILDKPFMPYEIEAALEDLGVRLTAAKQPP